MNYLPNHVTHSSGRRKTVCTSSVLAFFGISPDSYRYSQNRKDVLRILRSNGLSARSRKSKVITAKCQTIGAVRARIKKLGESGYFYVGVVGHAMVLDGDGNTVVDTAPRKRDRRRVTHVYHVS